jgi:mono/diheme cytochrome c family protein
MSRVILLIAVACMLVIAEYPVGAEDLQTFAPEQILAGSAIYSRNCATCHGAHMLSPDVEIGAFDLRQFPRDQHDRFVASVTRGKNTMPPWGDRIRPAEIEALWAYVCAGEK